MATIECGQCPAIDCKQSLGHDLTDRSIYKLIKQIISVIVPMDTAPTLFYPYQLFLHSFLLRQYALNGFNNYLRLRINFNIDIVARRSMLKHGSGQCFWN